MSYNPFEYDMDSFYEPIEVNWMCPNCGASVTSAFGILMDVDRLESDCCRCGYKGRITEVGVKDEIRIPQ